MHSYYEDLKTLEKDVKAKTLLCHYGDRMEYFDVTPDGFMGLAKRGIYYDF